MNTPAETIAPSVHTSGFTLVEEDDVAFSLSLCKEIHRIYGSYQSGELEASDSVHLGLSLTVQVLGTLGRNVTKGMPAMRIEVAAAQAREMTAVMFGEPVTARAARSSRQRIDRRCSRSLGPHITADAANEHASGGAIRSGQHGSIPALPEATPNEVASPPIPDRDQSQRESPRPLRNHIADRARCWIAARSLAVRMVLAVVGCAAAAVLVDIPIVMLLLYSNMCLQLLIAYVAIGFWARGAYRRSRRPPPAFPSGLAAA